MKNEYSFLNTLRIAAFDFKEYRTFIRMKPFNIIFNRVLFVLIISIFYMFSFHKNVRQLEEFNNTKHEIFEDINYSNGVLDIKNSPVIFTPKIYKSSDFVLIGDTRDDFNINNYEEYDMYKTALVLTRDSVLIKSRLREFTIKYSDIRLLSSLSQDFVINKEMFFTIISSVVEFLKYVLYIVFPISMIFDYFLFAFITSFFGFMLTIISRFRVSFGQVYKMILFAQSVPYLIISIFEIISEVNGVNFIFPVHILQFLTLLVFLISLYSIKRDIIRKNINMKK